MSRLMGKRVRIGKYAIPALLLATLVIGTVAAVAYVILTWTMTLTVAANPRVHFYNWVTSTKANTFSESFNIFPDIKTIEENATYGINSVTGGACSMRIASITGSGNMSRVYIKVYNASNTILEITWIGGGLPTTWTDFTTDTGKKYAIWMEVTGASGATIGATPVVTVEMKVVSP